jgi:hypothetical protein
LPHFKREHVEPAFQLSDSALQRFLWSARRLLKEQINSSSGHLGDAPDSIREAEFTEALVFLGGEAKADHPAATFNRHGIGGVFRSPETGQLKSVWPPGLKIECSGSNSKQAG